MRTQKSALQLIQAIAQKLLPEYKDTHLCTQYAWWLLEHVTHNTKTELLTCGTIELSAKQEQQLAERIEQLVIKKMPLQYVLGSVPFCGLTILVKPPILIPRQETEEWVQYVITQLKHTNSKPLKILDMCTGSGCIALALAHAFPDAHIYAADIEPKAIVLAQNNAAQNNISNVTFIRSDLFAELPKNIRFDCIVTNPPYIAHKEWKTLEPSVKEWEDTKALVAQDSGYAMIQKIIATAHKYLQNNAQLFIEVGHQQAQTVAKMMQKENYNSVGIFTDMGKKERVVYGSKPSVANSQSKQ